MLPTVFIFLKRHDGRSGGYIHLEINGTVGVYDVSLYEQHCIGHYIDESMPKTVGNTCVCSVDIFVVV
jgi:hypothetical protein